MKSFQELREATTGRDGVKCSAKKSQFGGYTPTCTRNGRGIYSAQQAYTDADTAKKHAEVYADAYYAYGDKPAQRAVRDFVAKNKSKLRTKNESVEVEEGKLPPHLAKFFDKDGNLNKDAEERVKKGRKAKGLDPRTGKKLKSVKEDTVTLDEIRRRSYKDNFKRKEHEFEAELERQATAKRVADAQKGRVIYINKKVWKKGGKPVEFKDLKHAQNVIRSLLKKDPNKEIQSASIDYYKDNGDTMK